MPAPEITRPSWSDGLQPRPGSRIAVVGGYGAFGRALVEALCAADARVVIFDLPGSIARHPQADAAATIGVDATDTAAMARAFEWVGDGWGSLDGLVNLAGFTAVPPTTVETIDLTEWNRVLSGNLMSTLNACRVALPYLRRAATASIVNMSSGLGFKTRPGFGAYTAAKAAVVGLTKSLAVENGPTVRVNAVAPSAARTEFLVGGAQLPPETQDRDLSWFDEQAYVAATPLGRLCEPADVVGPVLFLLGPGAAFVTGQTLHVNGGRETP